MTESERRQTDSESAPHDAAESNRGPHHSTLQPWGGSCRWLQGGPIRDRIGAPRAHPHYRLDFPTVIRLFEHPSSSTKLGAAALGLSLALTGCISSRRPIVLDTTPPGALVVVDGVDSGHSTPCAIQLPDSRRTIEFVLDGYETESRDIRIGRRRDVVFYRDAATPIGMWTFPMFLNLPDFMFPIKEDGGEMPSRIHVRMTRKRQPLALLR